MDLKGCSATSIGMPGMSEGFHAKMSLLVPRKSTSALSYLEESVVPMRTTLTLRVAGVYEDLLSALHGLERPDRPLGVGCFFDDLLPDGRELFGGDNRRGMFTALNLALVGTLEVGANGVHPMQTRHLQL